jgi:hypothetical protein
MTTLACGAANVHDVVLVAPGAGHERWRNPGEPFDRVVVPADTLARYVADQDSDVVSVHNLPGAAVHVEAPVAMAVHGRLNPDSGWPGRLPSAPSALDLDWDHTVSILSSSTRLMAPSQFVAADLASLARPVDVVYPMVDPSLAAMPRTGNGPAVVWVGRLVRRKGLQFLVEHREQWSFDWHWSGHNFYGDVADSDVAAAPNRLETCVGPDQMQRLYSASQVVLCPYRGEGFGMVAAEAAAAGCRVVGFDSGGLREIAGVDQVQLVPPDDVAAFDAAVAAALDAGPVSEHDRRLAAERFAPENAVAQYLKHLELAASA